MCAVGCGMPVARLASGEAQCTMTYNRGQLIVAAAGRDWFVGPLSQELKKKKILLMDYKTKQKHIRDKDVCGPQSLKYLLLYKKNVADP